jgi:hypothetical protein
MSIQTSWAAHGNHARSVRARIDMATGRRPLAAERIPGDRTLPRKGVRAPPRRRGATSRASRTELGTSRPIAPTAHRPSPEPPSTGIRSRPMASRSGCSSTLPTSPSTALHVWPCRTRSTRFAAAPSCDPSSHWRRSPVEVSRSSSSPSARHLRLSRRRCGRPGRRSRDETSTSPPVRSGLTGRAPSMVRFAPTGDVSCRSSSTREGG